MVDGIGRQVRLLLNVSDVYKRFEKLPDNAEKIMEMFASFGELFVDGTLGRCFERDVRASPCQDSLDR